MFHRLVLMMSCLLCIGSLAHGGQTYYVSPGGASDSDGRSAEQPWQSLADALGRIEPGDTLVLLPGVYLETVNVRFDGSPDATTTIRAAEPGTAVLTGGILLDRFQRVPGYMGIYAAHLPQAPREVKELDTNTYLVPCPDLQGLENTAGSFFFDPGTYRLYVHCTDGGDPAGHALQAQLFGMGLHISPTADGPGEVQRVHIEGLVVHGYAQEGIKISHARGCRVSHCRVYDTGWGIDFWSAQNTEVTDCLLYRNGDSAPFSEGGHVSFRGPTMQGNAIRRCIAFDGRHQGLRFYGGRPGPGQADYVEATDNLAYNNPNGGVWFKSALLSPDSLAARNVSVAADYLQGSAAVAFRAPTRAFNTKVSTINSELYPDPATLKYPDSAAGPGDLHVNPRTLADARFVDPVRHDYRLQSDSPHRGAGPDGQDLGALPYTGDVFFVSPGGSDDHAGTSVREAWRTLEHAAAQARPGQTVYVLEGTYEATLRPAYSGEEGQPIVFRTRGHDRVILDGRGERGVGIDLTDRQHIVIEGFEVTGFTSAAALLQRSVHARLTGCVFRDNPGFGVRLVDAQRCRVYRNTFWNNRNRQVAAAGRLDHTAIDSNLFRGSKLLIFSGEASGLFCDYNAFQPIGPGQYAFRAGPTYAQRLSDWQAMTGHDTHSLLVSPHLMAPAAGDFRPAPGSPLIARGRFAQGIGARDPAPRRNPELAIREVEVRALTPTTATIVWHTPSVVSSTRLRFGTDASMEHTREIADLDGTFHYVALTDLEPGQTYFFQPQSEAPPYARHSNPDLARADADKLRHRAHGPIMLFTTPRDWAEPRTFYVAPDGDNGHDGQSPSTAWRTPARAVLEARAGDTVIFAGGRYAGPLVPTASGTAEHPIIFRAVEGQRAELHGYAASPDSACLRVRGLEHLAFEGFDFTGGNSKHQVALDQIDQITLRRCLFDTRSGTRINGMVGHAVRRLRIEDTVFHKVTYPIRFPNSPELDVVFDHCHFGVHGFVNFDVHASRRFLVKNSVLTSNIELKAGTLPWMFFFGRDGFHADYNLLWPMPYDSRRLFAAEGTNFYDPRTYTQTWEGLDQWRSAGYGQHSLVTEQARLNGYSGDARTTYQYEDFIPAADSPALGAGEDGSDIGPRPYGPFQRRAHGIGTLEKP